MKYLNDSIRRGIKNLLLGLVGALFVVGVAVLPTCAELIVGRGNGGLVAFFILGSCLLLCASTIRLPFS